MRFSIMSVVAVSVIVLVLSGCRGAAKPVPAEPVQKRVVEEPKKPTPEEEKALAQEKLLKEAKEEFERLSKEADQLVTQKAFAQAIETVRSFSENFAQTEFAQKIAEKIAQIEKLKKEEEERVFNEEARSVAEELIRQADALVADQKSVIALALLNAYLKKYEQTPSWKLVKEKYEEVKEKAEQEVLKKARELREAQEEFKKLKEEAETLAGKNEFDAALAALSRYPEKFAQTEWKENIKKIETEISQRKTEYEEHQRFLTEAREAAEKTLSSARALSQEKRFEEALSTLADYPKKFAQTENQEEITREIDAVKKMKAAYEEFLAAAEKECKNRIEEAENLLKQKKYEDALKVLSKYPPEYSKTEWATEIETFLRQTVQPEKVRYEAHQKFLQDARGAYESAMTRVATLIAANQFEEALSILKNFPGEYQSVYGAQVAAKLKDALEKKEEFQQRKRIMTIVGAVILSVVVLLTVIVLVVRRSPAVEEG